MPVCVGYFLWFIRFTDDIHVFSWHGARIVGVTAPIGQQSYTYADRFFFMVFVIPAGVVSAENVHTAVVSACPEQSVPTCPCLTTSNNVLKCII